MSIGPMSTRKITHWFARRSFQNRIFLLILFTSTVVMLAMSWYLTDITEERLHYQVGQRALIQAMQISAMPELVEAVQKRDLARIKELIDPMRSFSDATYITVGDAQGRRLYHVNPDEIGKSMEGGDSDEALYNAKSYVSVRKGSLGSSLRGKSPIQDANGKVIGIVSVGLYHRTVRELAQPADKFATDPDGDYPAITAVLRPPLLVAYQKADAQYGAPAAIATAHPAKRAL
ncbi:Sensor kinase CitA, DpiB [Klebsiella aerogenes]|nr:Sensor kinase CitA, DpiB [Klebsiella aerogenes]